MDASTYRTKLTRHIQSRVARQLDVSRSYVCMVVNGHRSSARILTALAKEYARVEREVNRFQRKREELAA
jgi:predicted XRE-type DNA-binding protein